MCVGREPRLYWIISVKTDGISHCINVQRNVKWPKRTLRALQQDGCVLNYRGLLCLSWVRFWLCFPCFLAGLALTKGQEWIQVVVEKLHRPEPHFDGENAPDKDVNSVKGKLSPSRGPRFIWFEQEVCVSTVTNCTQGGLSPDLDCAFYGHSCDLTTF